MAKRCRVGSAEPGALELNHLLDQLQRLFPEGAWFEEETQVRLHNDEMAHEAWVDAVTCELRWLPADEILRVREMWDAHYAMHPDFLDFLLVAALSHERERVKNALDALKKAMNKEHTH